MMPMFSFDFMGILILAGRCFPQYSSIGRGSQDNIIK
jgi:hypothetical protein